MGDARLIDGKAVATGVHSEVAARVLELSKRGLTPGLAIVLVGSHPASEIYVRKKIEACKKAGIAARLERFESDIDEPTLMRKVALLNADPSVHGILVQLPLPIHLSTKSIIAGLDPEKDVDGLHPLNVGRLLTGRPGFIPCTPLGVIRLLRAYDVQLQGKHAVVLGRSAIVGRPMSWLLLRAHATVTTCHRHTANSAMLAREADVLVSAVGKPGLVDASWVKPGAVVIDVGINRLPDGRIVGDVDLASVRTRASLVTPVPGGVGPMTVAMLLHNVTLGAERSIGL